jgi:nucleoside 2-deoxyribosyltransferase
MKLFITAKFKGDDNKAEIEQICEMAHTAGFEEFCFIRDIEMYQRGVFTDPHALMARARLELQKCDALLIDISDNPSGGRIIEAGVAFGLGKKIIVLVKKGIEIRVPILGIADHVIEYEVISDIQAPLAEIAKT